MKYTSTRSTQSITATKAILQGLSNDGGLFVPQSIPTLNYKDLINASYQEIAIEVLALFFSDFDRDLLHTCVNNAYNEKNFHHPLITNIRPLDETNTLLELFYGKTSAFKDQALSLYPYLLKAAMAKENIEHLTILTATSGDTGKAAMEAVSNVEGLSIAVLFPETGTSAIQKLQMNTQVGENVLPIGIQGNFDDAQSLVKAFFLNHKDLGITSANSISIARLLPQVIYYFDAYIRLNTDKPINIYVPTGNFGNILSAYIAKEMSLPIHKLVVCTNQNSVLYDFFSSGIYDISKRPFLITPSPSMDILVSSNLERLLYFVFKDSTKVSAWMDSLATSKRFTLTKEELSILKETFETQMTRNEDTAPIIEDTFSNYNILIDPHTATALPRHTSSYHNLIVSTASPYKFPALYKDMFNVVSGDDFGILEAIKYYTDEPYPKEIAALKTLPIRHSHNVSLEDVESLLLNFIKEETQYDSQN